MEKPGKTRAGVVLPDVHSDVGGGYHRHRERSLLREKPTGFIVPSHGWVPGQVPSREQLERSRAYALVDPDMAIPDELKSIAAKRLAGQSSSAEEEALLRRKYLHASSR